MDTSFQQILRIAADALSLKYSLDYAVLYWQDKKQTLTTKASVELYASDSAPPVIRLSLSESLMTAIRKPLVISKTDSGFPRLQIIIPLIEHNQKRGVMAFWGKPVAENAKETDRRFLDMIGLISLRVLIGLQQGMLISGMAEPAAVQPVTANQPDQTDFIKVGPIESVSLEPEPVELLHAKERTREESELAAEPIATSESVEATADRDGVAAEIRQTASQPITEQKFQQMGWERVIKLAGIGFLVFDKTGRICCENPLVNPEFFNLPLTEKSALEVLFEWGKPANPDSASFDKTPKYAMIVELMQSVFSRVTDIDVLKELLPIELKVNEKSYGLHYHYLKSTLANDHDRILVVFQDISKEKELATRYATEIERTNMIVKVALDIDGYYQYRRSTEAIFAELEQELAKAPSSVNLGSLSHNIQAIQGGAEIYEIKEIAELAEEFLINLETKIASNTPLRADEAGSFSTRLRMLKDRFQLLQKHYLDNLISDEQILDNVVYRVTQTKIASITERISEQVLRKPMEQLEKTFEKNYLPFTRLKSLEEITQKRLQRIKDHIRSDVVESGNREITQIVSALKKQPIGLMLRRYAIIAVNLGERLQKRVEVEIKGADIEVPFHTLEHVFTGLTFVIRNCVEHGLESMEERIALDKTLEGNIIIEAVLENNQLRIAITDDGRGIDVEKIRQAAVVNKVITESEANRSSDDQILKLMFSKGFSTKKDSNGTFGRGVGLSAVGSAVVELGGDIAVRTKLKQGTTIAVTLPL